MQHSRDNLALRWYKQKIEEKSSLSKWNGMDIILSIRGIYDRGNLDKDYRHPSLYNEKETLIKDMVGLRYTR